MRVTRARLASVLRLHRADWLELLLAQWLLLHAQVRLALARRGSLVRVGHAAPEPGDPRQRGLVERAAWAVDRVVAFGPLRARCLARSITLQQLLARRGVTGVTIRFGVRRGATGFEAHAWVEWAGVVVGEPADHRERFVALPGLVRAERS